MAKIDAPFVNKTATPDEYVTGYVTGYVRVIVGYIVEAYDETIANLYDSLSHQIDENFVDAFNLTYQIFEIMDKMYQLKNLGIVITHRDTTPNNIMYTKDPTKK